MARRWCPWPGPRDDDNVPLPDVVYVDSWLHFELHSLECGRGGALVGRDRNSARMAWKTTVDAKNFCAVLHHWMATDGADHMTAQ